MSRFRDNAGREWSITIDVVTMEVVHKRTGVKIWRLLKDNLAELRTLQEDPILLVRVLFVLCEDEASKLAIAPEQFGRALVGDALAEAHDAFLESYADFCPSHRRSLIRTLMVKTLADQPTPSGSATNSPESAESNPPG